MKTIRLFLKETRVYEQKMEIEVPEGTPTKELEEFFDSLTSNLESMSDITGTIGRMNVNVDVIDDPSMDSDLPDESHVELTGWEEIY
ncbi:hypothetical protein [Lysinibacillus sp. NPDC059133]|uniref:hypothetical protein n=1 Tax=Lysinibacillus sp. NPDC059133 TaxID=3346737 RepID=UPI00367B17F4